MKLIPWLSALLLWNIGAPSYAQEIVALPTRPGVTQAYFLARVPEKSKAIALLFPGSGGLIHLRSEKGQIRFGQDNFLVRSRLQFINRGVIAAIIDTPSDQEGGWGMTDEFRFSEQHFIDMSAVVDDLNKRFPATPLFLVGTSRGTVSAAALAAKFGQQVAGAVLTSTVFRAAGPRSTEPGPELNRFDFATIKIPLLFAHHVSDQCAATPYADAQRLSDKYPLISVLGGLPPKSSPCDPFSPHGYYGKESDTIEEIVNWMMKKPFRDVVK